MKETFSKKNKSMLGQMGLFLFLSATHFRPEVTLNYCEKNVAKILIWKHHFEKSNEICSTGFEKFDRGPF